MKFTYVSDVKKRPTSDILILPFFKAKRGVEQAADFDQTLGSYGAPIATKDFQGKEGELLLLYGNNKQDKRILLLGLGVQEEVSVEKLRRAYAAATKVCLGKKITSLNLLLPILHSIASEEMIRGVVEGLLLANYSYTKLKRDSLKDQPSVLIENVLLIGKDKSVLPIARKCALLCQAVHAARDLVNGTADEMSPQYLAAYAKQLSVKFPKITAQALGKKEIEKEKMGLLLAVSRASPCDPALITLQYHGNPSSKDLTALVGKGITYDTGGLNLKPTGSMETMRCDMGGAAAVLSTMQAIAALGLKVNVVGVIPSAENSIGPKSFKPGDVYIGYTGKSVEIGNTDAEGRLILADAIAYTIHKFKPTRLIDIATLTGAVDIALGSEAIGLLSNDDGLAEALSHAGQDTYERVWRLPLFDEYRDQLKSEIADIKNIGGRPAGTITAAFFIKEFVGKLPWAHLDIASMAYFNESRRYHPKLATGIGVRLLVSFLLGL